MRSHVGQRDLRRLLHHVAELAGEREARVALGGGRLDEQHVAAEPGYRQTRCDTRYFGSLVRLGGEARTTEVGHQIRLVDLERVRGARKFRRHLT